MPTIPQQQTIIQYVANSLQLNYTYAFYAPLPTDIQVYYQASNALPIPASDILVYNSQYTVTYNADPTTGGYITLLFTPTTGYYLTIVRQIEASLTTNFTVAQNFNGANLDAALDRLLLLIQQNQNYALERNLSYIINSYLPSTMPYTQLPVLEQNQVWIGSGSGVTAGTIAQVPSASLLQSMLANNAPGTDGARLVGFYDTLNSVATTVDSMLTQLESFYGAIISNTSTVINASIVPTKLIFSTVEYDPDSIANNSAFTPKKAGWYSITGGMLLPINAGTLDVQLVIYKNNAPYRYLSIIPISTTDATMYSGSTIVYLNGSTDFVTLVAVNYNSTTITCDAGSGQGYFTINLIGQ